MATRFNKLTAAGLLALLALLFLAACSPAPVEEPLVDGQRPLVITVFKPET